jgi:hypothetical protein
MHVYLDESGDTGWTFSSPYRAGGSSRFLCLAFLFVPNPLRRIPRRVITSLYHKYGWVGEKKAADATEGQKVEFAQAVNVMLETHKDIAIDCIIAEKENVQPHIRVDGNKLYNYMCKLVICDHLAGVGEFQFIPDKRSIKVKSGNSLADYLQTTLWFECKAKTRIISNPQESHTNYNLQFVDWVSHCVWSHYEDGEKRVFPVICKRIKVRWLFFSRGSN